MSRTTRGLVGACAALALLLSGCSEGTVNPTTRQPVAEARTGGEGPGALLSAYTLPDLDPSVAAAGVRAARVTYRSTDATTDEPTVVSGTVFVPDQDPPEGGWKVVALGHGSTGIDVDCAPSDHRTLADQVPLVLRLTKLGLAVTMADFQGLGEPGIHPYGDSRTAGRNVIDSVRAIRSTFNGISDQWAALGGSQGGGAVWAADEEAATYSPELDLVGVLAFAPAADLVGLVDKAVAGTLTEDQRFAFQWVLESLGRLHPDLDLDQFRRGRAAAEWETLSTCEEQSVRDTYVIGPGDLTPRTPAAAEQVRRYLTAWALPHKPLSAPLLVAYGEKDTFIDSLWTTRALAKACQLGGTIQAKLDPDGTHGETDIGDPVQWLAARFAGEPAQNDCPAQP